MLLPANPGIRAGTIKENKALAVTCQNKFSTVVNYPLAKADGVGVPWAR
jgi:hypothetical protein